MSLNWIFFTLLIALVDHSECAGISCKIDKSIETGTNSVVITISPTPLEVLARAGLGNSRSAITIISALESRIINPAIQVSENIQSKAISLTKALLGPFTTTIPTCRFYWISNQLICDNVNGAILRPLCAAFELISRITKPISVPLPKPKFFPISLECEKNTPWPWGVRKIGAPECWASGYNGSGIIIANIDSGVRATHVELKDNFRPSYNWFNAYNSTNLTPVDNNGHGTHTMGTMVGKTLGVAPGAQWIACKGCDGESCDNEPLLKCGQWLLCPDRKVLNCTTHPNIINNSWGGGVGDIFYNEVLGLMKRIGIINIISSGNDGPLCGSVVSPADQNSTNLGFFSVGAVDCMENIGSYSSVGPSKASDYISGLGVQIVGPGSNVLSAWHINDTSTNLMTGTSMASPHVCGAVALLMSKTSNMTFEQVAVALHTTTYKNSSATNSEACTTNMTLPPFPNNVYGFGRINAFAALVSFNLTNS